MSYKLKLEDDQDLIEFDLLEVPIEDPDIEGATDVTTLNGNVWTDFVYLKKQWEQSWKWMEADVYAKLRGFYTRQWTDKKYPYLTISDVRGELTPISGTINTSGESIFYEHGVRITDFAMSGNNMKIEPDQMLTVTGDVDLRVGNNIYSINFGDYYLSRVGDYADRLEKVDGVWKITQYIKKLTLNGSEGWTWMTTGSPNNFFQLPDSSFDVEDQFMTGDNDGTPGLVISDKLESIYANDASMKANEGIGIRNNIMRISVPWQTGDTVAHFDAYLAQLQPTIYYVLKTPREITITDQALIAQLDEIASLDLRENQTGQIMLSNENEFLTELEVTYDYEYVERTEVKLVDHKAVRLDLSDGGVINNCGMREKIKLKMRESVND